MAEDVKPAMNEPAMTEEQIIDLVRTLPPQGKRRVMAELSAERDQWWKKTAAQGEDDMRRLASGRGRNWDDMTEAQRERFIDELLHETDA